MQSILIYIGYTEIVGTVAGDDTIFVLCRTEENAIATAEGAIAQLICHSPYNIEGAKIIVTGYGYCGKAIAKKLSCSPE